MPSRILSLRMRLYSAAKRPVTGSDSSKNDRLPISSAGIGVLVMESCTDESAPNPSRSWHQAEKTASWASFRALW